MWRLLRVLIWVVFLAILPTYNGGFWGPKAAAWFIGSWALATSLWWNAPSAPSLRNPWLGALAIWLLLLFAWRVLWIQLTHSQTTEALVRIPWVFQPILPTFIALGSLFALEALVRHTDSLVRWVFVARSLCYVAGFLAVYGLCQFAYLDPLGIGPAAVVGQIARNGMVTVMGNPMLTANALAILAPLCLMFSPLRYRLIYGFCLVDLLLIQSTASLLAFFVGTLTFCFLRGHRLLVISLLSVAGLFLLYLTHHYDLLTTLLNSEGRVELWQRTWQLLKASAPWMVWTGVGMGFLETATFQSYLGNWSSLHNEYLQIIFETGLIGFFLVLGAAFHLCRRLWKTELTVSLMGWVAASMSYLLIAGLSFPLRVASLLMVGVLIVASLEAHTEGVR